jgi:molybdate transport system ATP-binding protein
MEIRFSEWTMMSPESNKTSSKPFLTLDHVTIRLRDRFVFEDTCWQIKSDEQWALIGPNGAGKSTLAKALAGDLPIVRGRAAYHFLEGADHYDSAPDGQVARVAFDTETDFHRSEAGIDWFSAEQDGEVTVAENILWGSLAEGRIQEERLREIAQKLDMEHLLGRACHVLSNGEAKKVLIARALLRSPSLLILDEPFEGLDERAKGDLKELIDSLMTGPMRVVLVTHRFKEISSKITHVLCVKDCRVMLQGSTEEILKPERIPQLFGEGGLRGKGKGLYSKAQRGTPSSAPQELIRMKSATVRYGGHVVLDHIDWTVRRGENWAILGPNGAGKSKLLDLITGDNVQGYANDIHLFGRKKGSGESLWEIREKLSVASAEFQMRYQKRIPAYDVVCSGFFDSIGLYQSCTEEQHRTVREWLGLLNMEGLSGKRFDHLSHGQQRLILLARAMVKSPLLMILDEPCEGLDYANRRKVLEFIEFIGSQTATDLIYVTHHKDELPSCITHALVLDKGKVVASGNKEQVVGSLMAEAG